MFLAAIVLYGSLHEGLGQTSATNAASAAALLREGVDQAARGQFAEADLTLEKAERLEPDNPEILTSLGKVKARVGEIVPATAFFRRVVALEPRSAEAHLDLAVVLADAHQYSEALTQISQAQNLSPNLPAVHLNRARILADMHRTAEADAEFSKSAALAPSNPDCFFYWALLEREIGNLAKQTSLLQTLVTLQPFNDEAWMLLGNSLSYQSRQAEAIASWRKALSINPHSSQAVYKLSRALRATDPAQAKQLEDDFAAMRESSALLDKVKTLGNQGYAAMQAQNWTSAIAIFKQAVDLCADCAVSATLHKDLGLAYCNSGQWKDGRTELESALRADPNDPDIVRALTLIEQRMSTH